MPRTELLSLLSEMQFSLLRTIFSTSKIAPYADVIDIQFGIQRGSRKTKRDETDPAQRLTKPDWIRIKAASPLGRFREVEDIVHTNKLVTVRWVRRMKSAFLLAVGVAKLGDVVEQMAEVHRSRIQMDGAKVLHVSVHSVDEMKRCMVECDEMAQAAPATGR